jgi:hypothetical protein
MPAYTSATFNAEVSRLWPFRTSSASHGRRARRDRNASMSTDVSRSIRMYRCYPRLDLCRLGFRPRRALEEPAARRLSLSARSFRTQEAESAPNSGWSSPRHAGSSASRKRRSLRRRTSSLAVSRRNALRPRGPTIASISRRRSTGIRMCARCVLFICAYILCHSRHLDSTC